MSSSARYQPLAAALLLYLFLLGLAVFFVMRLNGGHFVYALDDPYIHLSLARRLAHGEYGINPGELCAPASSILYPLLLVPFAEWVGGPLLLNGLAALGCLFVLWRLLESTRLSARLVTVLLCMGIFAFNLIGQALEGMEHLIQLLLTLLALWGVVRREQAAELPRWLPLVLLLGPLVRYENLAVTGLGVLYLLWRRQFTSAGSIVVLLGLLLGGFSFFLKAQGLGWLPTSVEAKAGINGGVLGNLTYNLRLTEGRVLLGSVVVALGVGLWQRRARGGWLCLAGALVPLAHLLGGSAGFGRYEVYALALSLLLLSLLLVSVKRVESVVALWLVGALVYGAQSLAALDAAAAIYEQQFQMARFVRDYAKQPVAVNDIGLVRYSGGAYVLDLYGLACREALLKNRSHKSHIWMETLAEQRGVELVMLYDWWLLRDIPPHWVKVGELCLSQPAPYLGGNVVSFYATHAEKAPALREKLDAFRPTLPKGVTLILAGEPVPG